MDEQKQDQATGQSVEAPKAWDGDFWEKGMEVFDKASEPAKPDGDCPGCDKDRQAKEAAAKAAPSAKPPYRVIKVQGKEVPIASEEELLELAQKGMDYTKKTQGVAEERKKVEGERSKFDVMSERLDRLMASIEAGKQPEKPRDVAALIEKTPFEEFGLDPDLADDWQKKTVTELHGLRKEREEMKATISKLEQMGTLMMTDKLLGLVKETVTTTLKEYPIDDVQDESGRSLTQAQFTSSLTQKAQANPNRPLDELAKEAIMELHDAQRRTKESATTQMQGQMVTDEMSLEEFKAKYPKLFSRATEAGVADHLATKGELPPTLKSRAKEVDVHAASKDSPVTEGSLGDIVDAAFNDPGVWNER